MLVLCLLETTAVFYMVDHELVLAWPEWRFGVRGWVLAWFRSYLNYDPRRQVPACRSTKIMMDLCWSVTAIEGQSHLRSAAR